MLRVKLSVFVYLVFILCNLTFAQGNIKGVVTDQFDGESLYGANIVIMGTSLGTASDMEGKYIIRQIPAGDVQIKFSYIGYETQIIDAIIVNGKTLELNIALKAAVLEGEEIEVTAQALGQVAAINQQLSSNTIINVVSEEKIQELPDANAAEALGRLPGVSIERSGGEANKVMLRGLSDKYLNVTIDGVRIPTTDALERGLDLSTISQSSLAGIELYKALTPDKDADAIAGTINLVTKKAPEQRELKATLKGGYNKLMDSFEQYDFSLKYGERFFDNKLGLQLTGNLEQKIRSNEEIHIDYTEQGEDLSDYYIGELEVRFNDEERTRRGIGAILDYNTPDEGNIKLSSMYNFTKRDYILHTRNYPDGDEVEYDFRDREEEIDVWTNSILGTNHLFGMDLDWSVSYAQSETTFPYDYELIFIEPKVDGTSGMMAIPGSGLRDHPEELIDYAYNNFKAATLNHGYYRTQDNSEDELTAYLNLTKEYVLSNKVSGSLKGGAKYRSKGRTNENSLLYCPYYLGYWQPYVRTADGSIVEKDFSGSSFEEFWAYYEETQTNINPSMYYFLDSDAKSRSILDDFEVNPLINRDKMREWYAINKDGVNQTGGESEYTSDPSVNAYYYDITESVSAAYLMNTFNIGQAWTIILGARVEHESNDYNSKWSPEATSGFPVPRDVTRDTSASYSETDVLPHLHINLKATSFMNIRIAAYRALARPDFNMRLPTYFAWRVSETGGSKELVVGNPNLKTAKAWNFELNTSFFSNKIGLISISGFYKRIDDMYHLLDGISTEGDTLLKGLGTSWENLHSGTYELTIPYNSTNASEVWGFEFEHQINFTWLPGLLKNFVLSYNFSLVKSETTLIESGTDTVQVWDEVLQLYRNEYIPISVEKTQRLEDQPEFFGNIAVGYDIGGFSGRLSVFHQSEYTNSYSSGGRSDHITGEFTRMDLALKYSMNDNLTFLWNINNLTNIKEEEYTENRDNNYKLLRNAERYGMTMDFGVRISI